MKHINWHTKLIPFFLIATASMFTSCESVGDCFHGAGETTTETRELQKFKNVVVEDNIHVTLLEGSKSAVEITAGKNLLAELQTEISDGELQLENTNSCEWARSYDNEIHATVYFSKLNQLCYKGSGKVVMEDTVVLDYLNIVVKGGNQSIRLNVFGKKIKVEGISGSGDVTLFGYTDTLEVDIDHAGLFDFSNLPAKIVKINHAGTNHAFVNATRQLHVQISHVGDVFFEGDPRNIEFNKTGEGDLLPK
jgi:hypothetical protein